MMKRFLFGMAAFTMLFASSCTNELDPIASGNTSTVSFKVETPEIESRAYSDGTAATVLKYAVYDADGAYLTELTKTVTGFNKTGTVNLQLTTGNTYSVIFWTGAEGAPYNVDFANRKMTVNYEGAKSNDENRDAFYKYHTFTVNGAQTETIELRRPFAQLNIGTADYTESTNAGYTPTQSSVTVKKIYSTLNLATGEVDGLTEVTFASASIKKDETFPAEHVEADKKYEYLAMNYLLVAADKETVDVEYTYTDGSNAKTRTVGSVPVQRNYRTNIYGNLLTSEVDVNVEIKPAYELEMNNLYNVVVDGVSYDDFAIAVAKAMELNKPVEFIQNVAIDADETIEIPAGKTLTLNLNGYTLSGETDQTSNREMFLVKGTMTVNGANTMAGRAAAEGNGLISYKHVGDNMGWNAMTTIFNVTAGGVLNIKNLNAINFGGTDMGFVAHLNNWGEVTLNVENSTLESNYVAVRVFNSGYDKNNVTIKNSTLKGGSNAFWVHNYTVADFGSQEKADAQKALLNFDVFNGTNIFIGSKEKTPIRLGMNNALYADEYGVVEISEGIGMDMDGNYAVTAVAGLEWISNKVVAGNTFENVKIKLTSDLDMTGVTTNGESFGPIGRYCSYQNVSSPFKGHFDGNGHTIKGIYQSGWDFGYEWQKTGYLGLFGYVVDATVENLTIEGMESVVEGGSLAAVAGRADGKCVFKNITVKDTKLGTFNNRCGAIVGWTGYYKNEADETVCDFTFEDINICDDVVLAGLWGSFDSSIGGVMGQLNSAATHCLLKNVTVSCRIDAYNDCTASGDYYLYRMCGMIIGQMSKTTTIDGRTYPDVAAYGIEFDNVTVNYGDWMNYHYCEPTPGLNGGRGMRVEAGFTYDGLPEDYDHTQCVDNHMNWIPFDQLFGGTQYACKGVKTWEGVTVNYPESFYREQGYKADGDTYIVYSGAGFKTIATGVLGDASKNVTIELANDIDLAGIEWPAVCTKAAFVLDGKGYSIKNLKTSAVEDHGFYSTAMFTSTRKATTIKNVVVENATVTGKGGDNSHGAVLVACNYSSLNIEGVTIKNSTVSNCDRSSVIATYLYFTDASVKNCTVEGCTVNSIGTAGALLGMNNSKNFKATGNKVKNTTISSSEGGNKAGILIGTWQSAGNLTESENVVENSKAINAGTETNNNIGRNV